MATSNKRSNVSNVSPINRNRTSNAVRSGTTRTLGLVNPLLFLFHQVSTLHYSIVQMLEQVGISPTVIPQLTPQPAVSGAGSSFMGGGIAGRPLSPETRRKISAYQKKRWRGIKARSQAVGTPRAA